MSQEDVEKLIGRLFTDKEFRALANTQLERLCFEEGYRLSTEEFTMIGQLDLAGLSAAAEDLDGGIKRSAARSGSERKNRKTEEYFNE